MIEMDTSYSHSDLVADYHDIDHSAEDLYTDDHPHESNHYRVNAEQDESNPGETSFPPEEGKNEEPLHLEPTAEERQTCQGYFHSYEVARAYSEYNIRDLIKQQYGPNFICGHVVQGLPFDCQSGDHFLFFHGNSLPSYLKIGDFTVVVERPRNPRQKKCDCEFYTCEQMQINKYILSTLTH